MKDTNNTISPEEYFALTRRRSKFHNTPVSYDGYKFDSKAECEEYKRLKLRLAAGQIQELAVHPTFRLLDGFRTQDGTKIRAIDYEADFSYFENGRKIVVDVKGVLTEVFKIKKKLLLKSHPNIRLLIVKVGD